MAVLLAAAAACPVVSYAEALPAETDRVKDRISMEDAQTAIMEASTEVPTGVEAVEDEEEPQGTQNPDTGDVSIEQETFPCYLDSLENELELPVYFVNGVRDLPYIDLSDWADIMTTVSNYYGDTGYELYLETDGHVALLTRDNEYWMLVDFQEGTIAFEDYDAFVHNSGDTNLIDSVSTDLKTEEGTDILVKRNDKGSYDRYGKEVTLNLTDYHISVYWSQEEGLYLIPLQTLGDFLLSMPFHLNTFFNEEAVYLTSLDSMIEGDDVTDLGISLYSAPYGEMSEELAWYNYCELCLMLDHLYGLKEQHGIDSFDVMFSEIGYKSDLMSTDPQIVDGALNDFIEYYLDDLHSGFLQLSYRTDEMQSLEGQGLSSRQSDVDMETFLTARDEADEEMPAYEEVGNTAYITFDSFDFLRAPDEYYDKESEVPQFPSDEPMDTVALILYAHEQITRQDSPIENVVIDLSNNTGGAVDAACVTASWFLGNAGLSIKSTFTEALSTGVYQVDVNLDNEYDERDTVADKNLFCMISPVSFSCGNMVPSIFKSSHKVTLLGQTSGGGSCMVLQMSTAHGACFQISSPLNMTYIKNGSYYVIDEGVEPDVFIAKPENFYDREALTEFINDLF